MKGWYFYWLIGTSLMESCKRDTCLHQSAGFSDGSLLKVSITFCNILSAWIRIRIWTMFPSRQNCLKSFETNAPHLSVIIRFELTKVLCTVVNSSATSFIPFVFVGSEFGKTVNNKIYLYFFLRALERFAVV